MTITSTDKPVVDRRPRMTAHRAVTTVALAAAVLAVAAFGSDDTDTSVNRAADNLAQIQESSQPEAGQTELVVNGVPTSWARAGWPIERDDAKD